MLTPEKFSYLIVHCCYLIVDVLERKLKHHKKSTMTTMTTMTAMTTMQTMPTMTPYNDLLIVTMSISIVQ
jgi:uncharacterized membrane protein